MNSNNHKTESDKPHEKGSIEKLFKTLEESFIKFRKTNDCILIKLL